MSFWLATAIRVYPTCPDKGQCGAAENRRSPGAAFGLATANLGFTQPVPLRDGAGPLKTGGFLGAALGLGTANLRFTQPVPLRGWCGAAENKRFPWRGVWSGHCQPQVYPTCPDRDGAGPLRRSGFLGAAFVLAIANLGFTQPVPLRGWCGAAENRRFPRRGVRSGHRQPWVYPTCPAKGMVRGRCKQAVSSARRSVWPLPT